MRVDTTISAISTRTTSRPGRRKWPTSPASTSPATRLLGIRCLFRVAADLPLNAGRSHHHVMFRSSSPRTRGSSVEVSAILNLTVVSPNTKQRETRIPRVSQLPLLPISLLLSHSVTSTPFQNATYPSMFFAASSVSLYTHAASSFVSPFTFRL